MSEPIDDATPLQRFVLLGVLELDAAGETPAYSFDVYDRCVDRLDDVTGDRYGGVTRSDVIDALAVLTAADILAEQRPENESPTGKGRPSYAPAVDPPTALDALAGYDALAGIVEEIRGG